MLERAGLIARGRDAQRRPARIEGKPLEAAHTYLERFREIWDMNFARLDSVLKEVQDKPRAHAQRRKSGRQKRS
jgi:DNA-binding PadR family transcriptional regulator